MRVIAGRFKGRRLAAPPGRGTRPTSDRVREALFSVLGPLDGERVLDAFAGSGALGFEALSRGAEQAVFFEKDARAARVLEQNAASLRVPADEWELRRGEALDLLGDASSRGETYSLVLCDPPYRLAAGLGGPLSEALAPLLTQGARVVTESDRRDPLSLTLPLADERRYGDTLIRIHSHEP